MSNRANNLNSNDPPSRRSDITVKLELGRQLREILLDTNLKQRELASILNIQQPEVSHIFNQRFSRFTIDKLIQFLDRLGWIVKLQVIPRVNDCEDV